MGAVVTMFLHQVLLNIFLSGLLFPTVSGLQCYVCDSVKPGDNCDDSEENPGQLQDCPAEANSGCFIGEVIAGEEHVVVQRGCIALQNEDEYKCEVKTVGGHAYTFCNCHGDGCNEDWDTAAGPAIKCYVCDSAYEETQCDESHPGELEQCGIDQRRGCFMSAATYGDLTVFERGCSEASDPALFVCKDINRNGQELHFCNCHGEGCNKDWDSAEQGATGATGGASYSLVSKITIIMICSTGLFYQ